MVYTELDYFRRGYLQGAGYDVKWEFDPIRETVIQWYVREKRPARLRPGGVISKGGG